MYTLTVSAHSLLSTASDECTLTSREEKRKGKAIGAVFISLVDMWCSSHC